MTKESFPHQGTPRDHDFVVYDGRQLENAEPESADGAKELTEDLTLSDDLAKQGDDAR
jgi:hypothetical protein